MHLLKLHGIPRRIEKPEAAYLCAEQAKTVAEKVLEFDADNSEALRILETISDEFNVL